jgi:hypothetical protein
MTRCIGNCLAVISGLVLLLGVAAAAEEPGEVGNAKVVVAGPEEERVRHLSWPKIVRTANGTLVLGYSAGIGHNRGGSGLAVSVSKDDGLSFSPPKLLTYFPDDDRRYDDMGNLAMGLADDGKSVVILAMGFKKESANTIVGWRSEDAGERWARVDTANLAESKTGSVFGHLFDVPGKGLAVCGHYRKPKGNGIWIAYSADQGRSWGTPQTINGEAFFEPVFVFAKDRLIGLVRENGAHAYHQLVSDDLGGAWKLSRAAIQGDKRAVHPSPCLIVDPRDPNTLYALVSERAPSNRITLWKAGADSLEWKPVRELAVGGGDWTYPWMIHLGGDDWYLVYYQGDRDASSIYGKRIVIGLK